MSERSVLKKQKNVHKKVWQSQLNMKTVHTAQCKKYISAKYWCKDVEKFWRHEKYSKICWGLYCITYEDICLQVITIIAEH